MDILDFNFSLFAFSVKKDGGTGGELGRRSL